MDRDHHVPRPHGPEWETPGFEEISVSAEATAYMGTWQDSDWD